MVDRYRRWIDRKTAERCVKNLTRNGFDARFVPTAKACSREILSLVSEFDTFGLGGSETIRQLGVIAELKGMGKTIYDHWLPDLSMDQIQAIRLEQGRSDCFLCSANAISAQGEIVNVDGIGNRVSAMTFGPRKVIIVAGVNKIVPDLDQALQRVRQIAAPMRAKSMGVETPCAETGECADCRSNQRICCITTILHHQPMNADIAVILVGTALGY